MTYDPCIKNIVNVRKHSLYILSLKSKNSTSVKIKEITNYYQEMNKTYKDMQNIFISILLKKESKSMKNKTRTILGSVAKINWAWEVLQLARI